MAARSHSTAFSPAWRRLERASKKKPNAPEPPFDLREIAKGLQTIMSTNSCVRKTVSRKLLRDEKIHSRTTMRACFDRLLDNPRERYRLLKNRKIEYNRRQISTLYNMTEACEKNVTTFLIQISAFPSSVDEKREKAQSLESNLRSRNFL